MWQHHHDHPQKQHKPHKPFQQYRCNTLGSEQIPGICFGVHTTTLLQQPRQPWCGLLEHVFDSMFVATFPMAEVLSSKKGTSSAALKRGLVPCCRGTMSNFLRVKVNWLSNLKLSSESVLNASSLVSFTFGAACTCSGAHKHRRNVARTCSNKEQTAHHIIVLDCRGVQCFQHLQLERVGTWNEGSDKELRILREVCYMKDHERSKVCSV